jgi:hypothetical protein
MQVAGFFLIWPSLAGFISDLAGFNLGFGQVLTQVGRIFPWVARIRWVGESGRGRYSLGRINFGLFFKTWAAIRVGSWICLSSG